MCVVFIGVAYSYIGRFRYTDGFLRWMLIEEFLYDGRRSILSDRLMVQILGGRVPSAAFTERLSTLVGRVSSRVIFALSIYHIIALHGADTRRVGATNISSAPII